jgi:hypothetical protein
MKDDERTELLLNLIEGRCDPKEHEDFWVPYMIECFSMIEAQIPSIAAESLQVCKDYAFRQASLQQVCEALQLCWNDLEKTHREMHLNDPDVSAIRAVICILSWQKHPELENFLNFISFYLRLLNNIEPHAYEQEKLLRKHFESCLTDQN